MGLFSAPQNLPDSYKIFTLILGLAGLFPFYFEAIQNKFKISRVYFVITVLHFSLYSYVNITSLMENWKDFAQPMIGQSSLTAFGNLVLRLLSIITTYLILAPLLVGSRSFATSLNLYVLIIDEYTHLGIDVKIIYRKIYIMISLVASLTIGLTLVFTAWHSIYFYELITGDTPSLKHYIVAFLADFYKIIFLCYGNMQLLTVYLISQQLNGFLDNLLNEYQEVYESQERLMKSSGLTNEEKKW